MNAPARLRTAIGSDRDAVIELIHALNVFEAPISGDRRQDWAAAEAYYEDLLDNIARNQGRLVVAEAEGHVVAAMGFVLAEDQAYVVDAVRLYGYVTDLVVHEDWRGRGIGRMLLKEAERLTLEVGLKRLTIGVLAGNGSAERAYRAFGMQPHALILTKFLGSAADERPSTDGHDRPVSS